MQDIKTPIRKVAAALRWRGEGLRATARILGAHKNTIAEWESRFAAMKPTWMRYGWCHTFIQLRFEGEEVYPGVGQRVDPADSTGWTVIVLERARRFLVDQPCGRNDATLFKKVMRSVAAYVKRTQDTPFLSDRERRYGNTLLCGPGSGVAPERRCQKAVGYASRTKAVNGIGAVPSARNIKPPNPNLPTPRATFPRRPSTRTLWKHITQPCAGATAPFGAEPTPMPRTPTRCNAPWTGLCCSITSSVRTGPRVRCRPCAGVSWRPLCALKRSG